MIGEVILATGSAAFLFVCSQSRLSREAPTGKADLAIGSLTISYEREQRVSFTTPFMNTGVSILYKTAKPSDPGASMSLLNWQIKNANPLV